MNSKYPIKVKIIFRTNYRTLNNLLKEKLHANGESLNGRSEVILYNRDDEDLLFDAKMANLILVNQKQKYPDFNNLESLNELSDTLKKDIDDVKFI